MLLIFQFKNRYYFIGFAKLYINYNLKTK